MHQENVSESKIISVGQAELVSPKDSHEGGNVHSSLQDKAGNLCFGTTGEGIYKYDGKTCTEIRIHPSDLN